MAKKSRYVNYYKSLLSQKKKAEYSTPKSVLKRLKQLKNQEFVVNIPIGEENE